MKKFFALFLSLVMVVAMGTTAFAAGNNGSITINNTVKDTTYTIYRIFDLESYDSEKGAYSYKVNETWKDFATSDAAKAYVSVDEQGYVTWVEGADVAAFAKLALENAPATNDGTATATADNSPVVFNNLPLGYYLVDTSLGALCGLTTTKPAATVVEKNAKPSTDKEVQEDSNNSWGDKNDADFGQTVNFRTTITVEGAAKDYVLHDTMSSGLTFDGAGSVSVTLNGTAVDSSNYTVTAPGADNCTFEVSFNETFCKNLKSGDKIVVSYTATVNENAVVGAPGETNKTHLDYTNDGKTEHTPEDTTTTYVWELNLFKYTGEDTPLAGAEFILYKTVNGVNQYAKITNGKLTGWTETESDATTLITPADGFIYIDGLDADTYYLKETKAPRGYNIMTPNPKEIIIGENGAVGETITSGGTFVNHVIKVVNNTGSELPETGGIGTTIFYVVGGILMLGAAILLITKKKMSVSKD